MTMTVITSNAVVFIADACCQFDLCLFVAEYQVAKK